MSRSENLFQEAQQFIPGGVNSPVRAFKAVGGTPIYFKSAQGPYLHDEDDKSYIDYVGSWGPMILGHAHPKVVHAVQDAAAKSLSFGAPTAIEITIAKLICELMPSIEKIRLVSSGTEAAMSAIRLARGFTGRDKIIKFAGCYHGHVDSLLVQAGSGALTFGVPSSPGVPRSLVEHTLVANFNDLNSVIKLFEQHGKEIAALIVEPIAGNMNCVLPDPEFLSGLRKLCDQYNSLLIFDEVMTGFRVALGGAQSIYQIKPDLTTLGKIIGGGLPVGAFGGRRDIMDQLAPLGPIYQAGTLSGNPVTLAAGVATLQEIKQPNFYAKLAKTTEELALGLLKRAQAANIPFSVNYCGGMFGFFFNNQDSIRTYDQVMSSDVERFKRFFHGMLTRGIYFAPSAFEAGFVSAAHGKSEISKTLDAAETVFANLSLACNTGTSLS